MYIHSKCCGEHWKIKDMKIVCEHCETPSGVNIVGGTWCDCFQPGELIYYIPKNRYYLMCKVCKNLTLLQLEGPDLIGRKCEHCEKENNN